jgi:hypothetical protein
MDETRLAQLAVRGAMFSPDPFTAFAEIKLDPPPKAKTRKRDRKPPDGFSIWLIQQFTESQE